MACVTTKLRTQKENISSEVNYLITLNLFTTITNANFDRDVIVNRIKETLKVKNELIKKVSDRDSLPEAALWYAESEEEFENKALAASVLVTENEDIRSLRELIIYGLKGLSAYSKHANALFKEDEELDAFLQSTLAKTLDDSMSVEELTALALKPENNWSKRRELLDAANTNAYGNPKLQRLISVQVRAREYSYQDMTLGTLKCFLCRPKDWELTYIRIQRCFRRIIIRHLKNILILLGITVTPGGSRRKNLKALTDRFL